MVGTSVRKLQELLHTERVAQLRARMDYMSGGKQTFQDRAILGKSISIGPLDSILPAGGLERAAATEINDCPSVVVDIIERVSVNGGQVAVVGWPTLSVAEVSRLENIIVIPEPGEMPLAIASVLV